MNSMEATASVIDALEQSDIEYMLVGALSSNAYGIPRSTKDADIVVSIEPGDLGKLMDRLSDDFRLDRQMQLETITQSVRNVVTYVPTKFDIELFRLGADDHHAARFQRRRCQWLDELDREVWLPTAEDVVIQKLRWQRRKDLDDVTNVLAVRAGTLDLDYIMRWAKVHETLDLLRELRDSLPKLDGLDES